MKTLLKVDRAISKVIMAVVSIILFVIMCLLFLAVIFRYFLNRPIIWADELSTYGLVTMTFLGAYLAMRQNRLVKVTILLDIVPEKIRKVIKTVSCVVVMALISLLGGMGAWMLTQPIVHIQKTVALRWPMIIFYTMIPLMCALLLLGSVLDFIKIFAPQYFAGEEERNGGDPL